MTRRFLDNVRADLSALLVTNGNVKAPDLNAQMQDLIDSSIQDEAVIASNQASLAVPTAMVFAPLTTGIYDTELGNDNNFLTTDIINGNIKTSPTAGFTYSIVGNVSFQDLGSNVSINFSILENGVQVGFIAELTGGGGTRARTVTFAHVSLSTPANAVYTIGVETPAGINTIDVNTIGLSCTIKPTNNP